MLIAWEQINNLFCYNDAVIDTNFRINTKAILLNNYRKEANSE